jgi:LuxR family quorum sensing-dependent transcriptional regulator
MRTCGNCGAIRMTLETSVLFGECFASISIAHTPACCAKLFLEVLRPYQVEIFACGEVDLTVKERTVFFVIEWPDDWRNFYLSSGLADRDPVVAALAHRHGPFTWSELRTDRQLSLAGTEGLQRLSDHGWTEGLVVPIPRGGARFGLVSMAGRGRPFTPDEKSLIALLSIGFHERVRAMAPEHGFPVPPAGLTDREIQCLTLIAHGRSDRAVGAKLGIAQSTAHEYLENAKRKLQAGTRAQAVALAVSLGIIAP